MAIQHQVNSRSVETFPIIKFQAKRAAKYANWAAFAAVVAAIILPHRKWNKFGNFANDRHFVAMVAQHSTAQCIRQAKALGPVPEPDSTPAGMGQCNSDRNSFIIIVHGGPVESLELQHFWDSGARTHFALMCCRVRVAWGVGLDLLWQMQAFYNCNRPIESGWADGYQAGRHPLVEALLLLSPASAMLMVRIKLVMIATSSAGSQSVNQSGCPHGV